MGLIRFAIYVLILVVLMLVAFGCSTWVPMERCRQATFTDVATGEAEADLLDQWACKRSWKFWR